MDLAVTSCSNASPVASVVASPYRLPGAPPVPIEPAELVYRSHDRERHASAARAAARLWIGGVLLAGAVYSAGFEAVSAMCLVVVAAYAVVRFRRHPEGAGVVLRVKHGELDVIASQPAARLHVPLGRIANVSLDTKTIRKVQEGNAVTPALRFLDSKVGPEVDVARIAFDVDGYSQPVNLSEAYFAHMDSIEWLGKIRVFLRAQGWVPQDERGE
jgi:hypothetical protein